jgi:hypothetical protein
VVNINPLDLGIGLGGETTNWKEDIGDFTEVYDLAFEMGDAGSLGKLVIAGPVNLCDQATATALASLGTNLSIAAATMSLGGTVGALEDFGGAATLYMYNLPFADSPGIVYINGAPLVVVEPGGTVFHGDYIFYYDYDWNEVTGTGTLTLTVNHWSSYEAFSNEVWVDSTWTSQTDVNTFNPALVWQSDAFAKIQDGINAVDPGGTVHVLAGTYKVADESWDGKSCVYINKSITLSGAGSDLTILDAEHTYSVLNEVDGHCGPHCTVVWNEAPDITIEGLTVANGDYGIRNTTILLDGGPQNSATFTDVVVTNNYGIGILFENNITTATFTGCEANNSGDFGIYFNPTHAAGTVSLTNTSASNNGHVGFSCQGSIADLSIVGGTFNYNTGGPFHYDCETWKGPYYGFGIELGNCVGTVEGVTAQGNGFSGPDIVPDEYGLEGGAGIVVKGASTNITITGANLHDNMNGLWIEDPDAVENWHAGCVGFVEIHSSNIAGNTQFGILDCVACLDHPVDATDNWWGSASGPTHAGNTFKACPSGPIEQGDAVSDNVDYCPWLDAPYDEGGESFAPVVNDITGDEFSSIGAAVAAAGTENTIFAWQGKFTEAGIVIDQSLIVQSASGDWRDTIIDPTDGAVFEFATDFSGNTTISGFTIAGGEEGVYIVNGLAEIGTVNVNNCLIRNNGTGIYGSGTLAGEIYVDNCIIAENGIVTGIHLADVVGTAEITDSVIGAYWDAEAEEGEESYAGNAGDGIEIDKIFDGGTVIIDNNKIVNNEGSGIADAPPGCYGELTITNNVIGAYDYDTTAEPVDPRDPDPGYFGGNEDGGIYLDYVGSTGKVTITGNTVTDNDEVVSGIHIESADVDATVRVNFNNIEDNIGFGVYYHYYGVDHLEFINATNNWWGHDSGPGGVGPGTGDEVSANVDYDPWLGVPVTGGTSETTGGGGGTVDAKGEADITVDVTGGGATVTVAEYSENPGGGFSGGDIGKYVDVRITDATCTQIEIRLYYTQDDIDGPPPLNELSLKLYWWDGGSWQPCSESGVTVTWPADAPYRGFIWANIRADTFPDLTQITGTPFGGGTAAVSAGGGGGGGGAAIVVPTLTGLVATPSLELDPLGVIQARCQLRTADGRLTLDIAKGTRLINTLGNPLESISAALEPSPQKPPSGATFIVAYNLEPKGAKFSPAITLTIKYDSLPQGVAEENLYIAYWDGLKWAALKTTVDTEENEASGPTTHFTTFALIGAVTPPTPAAFSVSNLSIQPAEVQPQEAVNITLSVANTGGTEESYSVALKINGVMEAEESVTVAPASSQSVSFSVTREEIGSYSVDVNGLSGSFTVAAEAPAAPAPIAWWIWVIAGIVVAGLIIFFLARRRA